MNFEYYVLNYNNNKHCVENFNIFNNIHVQEEVEKAVKRYLRSPSKYTYYHTTLKGFDALCDEIRSIIQWQEWSRVQYEISVGDAFETDINKFEKWDCYAQCEPNIPIIAREVIYQYKQQIKEKEK